MLNSGILASQVKDFAVYDFPFMFANAEEADAVVDGPFGQKLHAKLEEKGMVGLAYCELGFRNITNSKRPITKVEDIAGLKLRVIPNAINVDWVKALGANPTPLAFPELYAALEQKAIDGQENPLTRHPGHQVLRSAEVPDVTNHQYNPQSVIVSKKFWDALSPPRRRSCRRRDRGRRRSSARPRAARPSRGARRAEEGRHAGDRVLAGREAQAARQDQAGDRQAFGERRHRMVTALQTELAKSRK